VHPTDDLFMRLGVTSLGLSKALFHGCDKSSLLGHDASE